MPASAHCLPAVLSLGGAGCLSLPDLGVGVGFLQGQVPLAGPARSEEGSALSPRPCHLWDASCKEAGKLLGFMMARLACPPDPQRYQGIREGGAALSAAGPRGAHLAEAPPLRRLQTLQQEAEFLGVRLGQALQVPRGGGRVSLLEPEQASPGAGRLRPRGGLRGVLQAVSSFLVAACP